MEPAETPSVVAVTGQASENAIDEVDSLLVVGGSSDDGVVAVPEIPSDDEIDHERISGEDLDQDHHGEDNLVENEVVAVPIDELKKKIIKQVEYYFSDENLPTDKFLLNAMKKNKKGFVFISTIATFHKMKKLTRDQALIVAALKESSFLIVSQDGKKVKRLSPLPEIKDPKLFTVLVENLPEDHSEENIREIFGKVGSIKSVSICDPNAVEESEKGCKKDKFIRSRLHAFVEYETVEAAEKAAATLNNEQDWRNGLRVKLLEHAVNFTQRRPARREPDTEKDHSSRVHDQTGGEKNKKANEHQHHRLHHSDTPADEDGGLKNGNKGRGRGRGRQQNHQGGNGNGHGTSPSTSSSFHHNYNPNHHHPVEATKRPPGPKMPDGTRGFTMGRGKPLPPPPTSAQTSHEL